ncbi:hypothetical protein CWE07_07975 [Aliidiomarina maris]|uniref:Uncharacterized protein n=1 Tax=Aliidiomarina maris TaxID=531312 RepID=A0ABY0BRB8_9GAMM|nr:hypothetical protein CWE07_07975 [Aliidiomarina maris]
MLWTLNLKRWYFAHHDGFISVLSMSAMTTFSLAGLQHYHSAGEVPALFGNKKPGSYSYKN